MIKRLLFAAMFTPAPLLAACGEDHLLADAGDLVPEFFSCRDDQADTNDERLRLTTVNLFRGQQKDGAINALKSQGFRCAKNTCSKILESRETNFERWFGVSIRNEDTHGKRYWHRTYFAVTFNSEIVSGLDDIIADFRSETALARQFTRPKDSDLEVVHD